MIAKTVLNGFNRTFAGFTVDPVHPKDPKLRRFFAGGPETAAGADVTPRGALSLPGCWRGLNVIGNKVMATPAHVYRHTDDGREIDIDHRARPLIRMGGRANPLMSSGRFMKTLQIHAGWYGNGLAWIRRDEAARPIELIPLLPDRSGVYLQAPSGAKNYNEETIAAQQVAGDRKEIFYFSKIGGRLFRFRPENVLHICGPSLNGFWGLHIVDLFREFLGGHLATAEHGHRVFGQGANIAGFVSIEDSFEDEEQLKRFQSSLDQATTGLGKAHRLIALEEGAKFHPAAMTNEDAQFLATREINLREQALIIGVQSSKIGDRASKSYNSLEMENQEHISDDVFPWLCCWSEEMTDKLLTEEEKETESHVIGFDESALEWRPFRERSESADKLLNGGVANLDEARQIVDLPPAKSPNAKRYRKPLNISYEDEAPDQAAADDGGQPSTPGTPDPVPPSRPAPDPDDGAATRLAAQLAGETLQAIARRLYKQAESKARKGGGPFVQWVDAIDPDQGPAAIDQQTAAMVAEIQNVFETVALEATEANLIDAVESVAMVITAIAQDHADRFADHLTQKEPTQ